MTNKPSFSYEAQFPHPVAGVDEAGCGPWAGPVVAAAVIFLAHQVPTSLLETIHDSKKLTKKKRENVYQQLLEGEGSFLYHHIALASVSEIDRLNIAQANRLAMNRAIAGLVITPNAALVDGNRNPHFPLPTQMIIKGDQLSFSIAAASILAKVKRDEIMQELDSLYPAYGWAKNAGYGTAQHIKALKDHGVTPHHRQSFMPIKEVMGLIPTSIGLLANLYEFPSHEWVEHSQESLPRLLAPMIKHTFTHFHLYLHVIRLETEELFHDRCFWIQPDELKQYALPTVMRKVWQA